MIQLLLSLDRRWVFLALALVFLLPMFIVDINIPPPKATPVVREFYNQIENLPPRSTVLISMDFDPASQAELRPMGEAALRHCFKKDLRVVVVTLWLTGIGMVQDMVDEIGKKEFKKEYGKDYVFVGWKPGNEAVVLGMGQNFHDYFSADYSQNSTASMSVLEGIKTLKDFKLVIELSAGFPGYKEYVQYGVAKYGIALEVGVTGVAIPELYPYLASKQVKGLLGGIKGAAEYEGLIARPGSGSAGMVSISFAHFAMILLILLSNVIFFVSKRAK